MVDLHHLGATLVLAAVVVTGLASATFALRGGSQWTERLRVGLTAVIGLQVAAGALELATGARPAEGLHLLYGIAALGVLPLAANFAGDATPGARAWVQVAACGVLLLIAWRLASTG
jgi:hypothetical protein